MPQARLEEDWTFRSSSPSLGSWLRRGRALFRRSAAPPTQVLRPLTPADRWICYFAYLPDGRLDPAREFTLDRLAAMAGKLLTVCATPEPGDVPGALLDRSDAVIWKGLSGYDFSAYAAGLREVAAASPGADVFVLNDSVYGPLAPLEPLLGRAAWDLTGFTASGAIENHIQSYAFLMRDVDPVRLAGLGDVLPARSAFDHATDVIFMQESRLARIAARHMSVGALWYGTGDADFDPTLNAAAELVRAGFPFLKRSLFTKHARFGDAGTLGALLAARGHPLPDA